MTVDKPNIVISAVKKCSGEDAVIVRLYETEGHDTSARIAVRGRLGGAWLTDLIEDNPREMPYDKTGLTLRVKPYSIETIKLKLHN